MHIGWRSGQSLARDGHTAEHEAHSDTWKTFREDGADERQRFLLMVLAARRSLRKKPRLGLQELERTHDLRVKLRGRLQIAVGDEGK